MYFCWANIYTLNRLRAARGLNTFEFRPHSGESGDVEHLASTFLLAKGINHGINLEKNTVLQCKIWFLVLLTLQICTT